MIYFILVVIALLVEEFYKPRIDRTSNEEYLLWYNADTNQSNRKFIKLW